jgi:RNA polymerase sigma factor (sigma-70 family)
VTFGEGFRAVLDAARDGDESAWTEIYRDLAPTVLGYLRGQRSVSPEDTASEVFLQIVRDLDGFEGDESSFRSWVFTIAHHRLIDARRADQRRPSDAVPVTDLDDHLPPDECEPSALDNVATSELTSIVHRLTPDQRDVLLLRFVAGLTLPEIATIVDKRLGAVKALQRRGLASLQNELAADPYPLVGNVTLTPVR